MEQVYTTIFNHYRSILHVNSTKNFDDLCAELRTVCYEDGNEDEADQLLKEVEDIKDSIVKDGEFAKVTYTFKDDSTLTVTCNLLY